MLLGLDWITKRPVTPVVPRRSYITLPAFDSVDTVWRSGAEIARQFNYTASNNFTLLRRPLRPDFTSASTSFSLAIRYRRGSTVHRWKLWESEWDAKSGIIWPLYRGEKIYRNFCLEAWTTYPADLVEGATEWNDRDHYPDNYLVSHGGVFFTAIPGTGPFGPLTEPDAGAAVPDYWTPVNTSPALDESIQLQTSIRALPTYPWDMSAYAQADGTAVSYSELHSANLTFPITFGAASQWLDN